MIGKTQWRRVAEAAPLDEVREAILSGYLDGKPFSPYAPLLEMPPFARMAPWRYVLSRGRSDFGAGVFREIASTGTFAGTVCNVVEHDPTAHGLKHCAAVPLWEALADDRHYEVVLASTVSR